jgi:hypothetical protein
MFFGWGKSSTNLPIPNNPLQTITTTFAYFHIAFLLRLTFARKWFANSSQEANEDGSITSNQKEITKKEVDQLIGKNPVNLLWWLFNQSLLWLVLSSIVFGGITNITRTGNIMTPPTKTVVEIIDSKYWTPEEEKLVVQSATDSEFEQFLYKFRNETNLKKAINARLKTKLNTVSSTSAINQISSSSQVTIN